MDNLLTAIKISQYLDVSVPTINNWYRWYRDPQYEKPEGTPPLPKYKQKGKRGTRYWYKKDLPKLLAFKDWIPKGRGGVMGDYNAKFWGDRGERALRNKLKKEEE